MALFATEGEIFQASTFGAMYEGVFDGTMAVSELKTKGNFGLGAFEGTEGELIAYKGVYYRVVHDGQVKRVPGATLASFATVVPFNPSSYETLKGAPDMKSAGFAIDSMIKNKNTPHAIRLVGKFRKMELRNLMYYSPPYPKFSQATKEQVEYTHNNIQGVLVGFWFPEYLAGINVPGYHFHFLSQDMKIGGHVLNFSVDTAQVAIQEGTNLNIFFPNIKSFNSVNLNRNFADDIRSVESKY